jgi:hypothetical protein
MRSDLKMEHAHLAITSYFLGSIVAVHEDDTMWEVAACLFSVWNRRAKFALRVRCSLQAPSSSTQSIALSVLSNVTLSQEYLQSTTPHRPATISNHLLEPPIHLNPVRPQIIPSYLSSHQTPAILTHLGPNIPSPLHPPWPYNDNMSPNTNSLRSGAEWVPSSPPMKPFLISHTMTSRLQHLNNNQLANHPRKASTKSRVD